MYYEGIEKSVKGFTTLYTFCFTVYSLSEAEFKDCFSRVTAQQFN